jgi:hypothetical protein
MWDRNPNHFSTAFTLKHDCLMYFSLWSFQNTGQNHSLFFSITYDISSYHIIILIHNSILHSFSCIFLNLFLNFLHSPLTGTEPFCDVVNCKQHSSEVIPMYCSWEDTVLVGLAEHKQLHKECARTDKVTPIAIVKVTLPMERNLPSRTHSHTHTHTSY